MHDVRQHCVSGKERADRASGAANDPYAAPRWRCAARGARLGRSGRAASTVALPVLPRATADPAAAGTSAAAAHARRRERVVEDARRAWKLRERATSAERLPGVTTMRPVGAVGFALGRGSVGMLASLVGGVPRSMSFKISSMLPRWAPAVAPAAPAFPAAAIVVGRRARFRTARPQSVRRQAADLGRPRGRAVADACTAVPSPPRVPRPAPVVVPLPLGHVRVLLGGGGGWPVRYAGQWPLR